VRTRAANGSSPSGTAVLLLGNRRLRGEITEAVGRYALSSLRRLRGRVAHALPAADLTALDQLLDTERPHSIPRRSDLAVRTERTVWAARRT
jgi:hypothetical protein